MQWNMMLKAGKLVMASRDGHDNEFEKCACKNGIVGGIELAAVAFYPDGFGWAGEVVLEVHCRVQEVLPGCNLGQGVVSMKRHSSFKTAASTLLLPAPPASSKTALPASFHQLRGNGFIRVPFASDAAGQLLPAQVTDCAAKRKSPMFGKTFTNIWDHLALQSAQVFTLLRANSGLGARG
eukprot:scaffold82056_cov18-Tisochrysis_lutea.AAC.1